MPHDRHGATVQVGDRVRVEFIVKEMHLTEDYCNLSLESVERMPPTLEHRTMLAINARQTVKVAKTGSLR